MRYWHGHTLSLGKDFFELIGALHFVVVQITGGRRNGRVSKIVAYGGQR